MVPPRALGVIVAQRVAISDTVQVATQTICLAERCLTVLQHTAQLLREGNAPERHEAAAAIEEQTSRLILLLEDERTKLATAAQARSL